MSHIYSSWSHAEIFTKHKNVAFFFFLFSAFQKYLNGLWSWRTLKFEWLWLGGTKLWLGPFFFSQFLISCWLGSNFLCATHIIPVKNEEGVVIMFILNFDYILNEASSDSLERLSQTSPSKADQCEYKDPFMYTLSPWTQYNSNHSDGCFDACPSPPSMCNGAVQVVPATQPLWHVDIISKIWPNYNCVSVKMSWWTTGASLEGLLFQKAAVKILCNTLQCSRICSWSPFSFLCCPFPLTDI